MATTIRKTFSRQTEVSIDIDAPPERVWMLLTNAAGYNKWCSTVISIDGEVAAGKRIRVRSQLAPERVFKLTVKEASPPNKLVWGDALGKRTFELTPRAAGGVTFRMQERIGGPLFPLFAKMIPPFDESFDRFAADLKAAAERAG